MNIQNLLRKVCSEKFRIFIVQQYYFLFVGTGKEAIQKATEDTSFLLLRHQLSCMFDTMKQFFPNHFLFLFLCGSIFGSVGFFITLQQMGLFSHYTRQLSLQLQKPYRRGRLTTPINAVLFLALIVSPFLSIEKRCSFIFIYLFIFFCGFAPFVCRHICIDFVPTH